MRKISLSKVTYRLKKEIVLIVINIHLKLRVEHNQVFLQPESIRYLPVYKYNNNKQVNIKEIIGELKNSKYANEYLPIIHRLESFLNHDLKKLLKEHQKMLTGLLKTGKKKKKGTLLIGHYKN
jgi:hypothetical protein